MSTYPVFTHFTALRMFLRLQAFFSILKYEEFEKMLAVVQGMGIFCWTQVAQEGEGEMTLNACSKEINKGLFEKNNVQFFRFVGHDNCSLLETSCDYHDVNKITLKPQTVLFYCVVFSMKSCFLFTFIPARSPPCLLCLQ